MSWFNKKEDIYLDFPTRNKKLVNDIRDMLSNFQCKQSYLTDEDILSVIKKGRSPSLPLIDPDKEESFVMVTELNNIIRQRQDDERPALEAKALEELASKMDMSVDELKNEVKHIKLRFAVEKAHNMLDFWQASNAAFGGDK